MIDHPAHAATFEEVVGATPRLRHDVPLLGRLGPNDQVRATNYLADNLSVYAVDPVRYIAVEGLLARSLTGPYTDSLLRHLVAAVVAARPEWVTRHCDHARSEAAARSRSVATCVAQSEEAARDGDWPASITGMRNAVLIDPDHVVVAGLRAEDVLGRLIKRSEQS